MLRGDNINICILYVLFLLLQRRLFLFLNHGALEDCTRVAHMIGRERQNTECCDLIKFEQKAIGGIRLVGWLA